MVMGRFGQGSGVFLQAAWGEQIGPCGNPLSENALKVGL